MGRRDSVVGGQIVILTGVDNHAGIAVDHAGEILVNDGTLHIDVAEQNAVQRIVQHHIQTLQSAHSGNLRHAQAGAIVAQADVAMLFLAHYVQSGTHQAEVLLRSVGAAEALRGCTVRHIVQQGLAGGADHGNDISALLCGRLSLRNILIDITGSHDDIQIRTFLIAELV